MYKMLLGYAYITGLGYKISVVRCCRCWTMVASSCSRDWETTTCTPPSTPRTSCERPQSSVSAYERRDRRSPIVWGALPARQNASGRAGLLRWGLPKWVGRQLSTNYQLNVTFPNNLWTTIVTNNRFSLLYQSPLVDCFSRSGFKTIWTILGKKPFVVFVRVHGCVNPRVFEKKYCFYKVIYFVML